MLIQIPFSGFYNSIHNDNIDNEIYSSMFTDYETEENNDNLSNYAYDLINWRDVYNDYAKEYCKQFAERFNLKLTFESLQSPREYNFNTDRIFAHIEYNDVLNLLNVKDIGLFLEKHAREMFTSRNGFMSFYNPDYTSWGLLSEWDCNQLYCLLMAWLECKHEVIEWNECELYMMEDSFSNGFGFDVIYNNAPGIDRLLKIHDRLNRKAA